MKDKDCGLFDDYDFNYKGENYFDTEEESCINCYFSNGKYCFLKYIKIGKYTPTCWGFRDSITMKPSGDFQCDEDYDDFN